MIEFILFFITTPIITAIVVGIADRSAVRVSIEQFIVDGVNKEIESFYENSAKRIREKIEKELEENKEKFEKELEENFEKFENFEKLERMNEMENMDRRCYPKPKLSKACYEELKSQGITIIAKGGDWYLCIDECYEEPIEDKIYNELWRKSTYSGINAKDTEVVICGLREDLKRGIRNVLEQEGLI